jgi:threonine aldolase
MKNIIDLRSDTVTKPSAEMRKAMYDAEVGDDVYGEDPTVNRLQDYAAELLGKEAALFVASGVMGNQICLNVLTRPGDEVICERTAHIFLYESGTPAKLSGIQLSLVEGNKGIITPEQIEPLIRPESAYYMPRSRVIEIENTHNVAGGIIIPIDNIKSIKELADRYNLFMHLDGARIWNASVAANISVAEYANYFETVSVCLSKGLGAPIGSIIAGDKAVIKEAFRVRKSIGGGMRQVGIIAAGGLYALMNNIERLAEDHAKAGILAEHLLKLESVDIDPGSMRTNILMFKPLNKKVDDVIAELKKKGLLAGQGGYDIVRLVTHMDISNGDIDRAKQILSDVLEN